MSKYTVLMAIAIILLTGCKTRNPKDDTPFNPREAKKRLEHINRVLVDKDREQIEAYMERMQLQGMIENSAGLYYLVWGDSAGHKVELNDIVVINYSVSLLDGTLCYTTKHKDAKEFLVGKGGVESGLEMGILLMHEGQKGKFILPPHLGHGLLGDNNKIPPLSILVFDVELLEVIKK